MLARLVLLLAAVAVVLSCGIAKAEQVPAKVVVFVPPRDIEAPLRDALTAQLSGVDVELVVEHFVYATETLKHDVDESRSLGAAHQAIGVFWLDTRAKDEWRVFLSMPNDSRILMRRIPLGSEGAAAAMEAVAVITRESTAALLAGQKIGMTEVVVPDEPIIEAPPRPPKPVQRPIGPRPFRPLRGTSIGVSYYGDLYAKEAGWQSGVELSAAWNDARFRVGATFVALQRVSAEQSGLDLSIGRTPLGLEAGYFLGRERWALTLSARATVEVVSRHVVSAAAPSEATSDDTRPVVFLSPRPRFDYRVTEALNIFATAGVDFALNGFSFVNRVDGQDRAVFEPLRVRPAVALGVAFWP